MHDTAARFPQGFTINEFVGVVFEGIRPRAADEEHRERTGRKYASFQGRVGAHHALLESASWTESWRRSVRNNELNGGQSIVSTDMVDTILTFLSKICIFHFEHSL